MLPFFPFQGSCELTLSSRILHLFDTSEGYIFMSFCLTKKTILSPRSNGKLKLFSIHIYDELHKYTSKEAHYEKHIRSINNINQSSSSSSTISLIFSSFS